VATTRLKIYNGALLACRARAIASLSVNEEARHLLDLVWDDGGVRYCLERGQWKFAMRASQLYPETSITPPWGYQNAFAKPTDWVDTSAVCQDEFFRAPCLRYSDEIGYWFADIEPIYVKYVSDDPAYGTNLANWPVSFTEYVKLYFASRIVGKIAQDKNVIIEIMGSDGSGQVRGRLAETLKTAKNRDAMAGPTTFPAQGSWTRARQGSGGRGPLGDGGTTGSLIG
jgi:hypothetical protein